MMQNRCELHANFGLNSTVTNENYNILTPFTVYIKHQIYWKTIQ